MAGVNAHVIFMANNMIKNGISQKLCSRMNIIERLLFSILEEHLKNRAKIKNLPRELKVFLSKYKIPLMYLVFQKIMKGQGYAMRKHQNNKTTVRRYECHVFVCKKQSDDNWLNWKSNI